MECFEKIIIMKGICYMEIGELNLLEKNSEKYYDKKEKNSFKKDFKNWKTPVLKTIREVSNSNGSDIKVLQHMNLHIMTNKLINLDNIQDLSIQITTMKGEKFSFSNNDLMLEDRQGKVSTDLLINNVLMTDAISNELAEALDTEISII